jgi:ribonuclease HI
MKAEIYVDGSWMNGSVGYGFVVLQENLKVHEGNGHIPNRFTEGTRQVAGELFAVGKAIEWCKNNHIDEVTIFYDYMGVEMWARGLWKANLSLTRRYKTFVQNSGLKITWKKVKSHTGDKFNDMADDLAKMGAKKGA